MHYKFINYNSILNKYADVINYIENLNDKISAENRFVNGEEAKRQFRLLIQLLELKPSQVSIKPIKKEKIYSKNILDFTNYGKYYLASTKQNKYFCVLVDDLPSMFMIESIDGTRGLRDLNLIGSGYKNTLSITFDNVWYEKQLNNFNKFLLSGN